MTMTRRTVAPAPPDAADTPGRVNKEAVYPHPPEKVWRALTEKEAVTRWLLPADKDIVPKGGERFTLDAPTGPVQCEVVEVERERRLAYTWHAAPEARPSLVTWTLTPTETGGTHVRLTHDAALPGGSLLRLSACLRRAALSPLPPRPALRARGCLVRTVLPTPCGTGQEYGHPLSRNAGRGGRGERAAKKGILLCR
jgi:uncharacterized protein YndB with AHSA1/START domain